MRLISITVATAMALWAAPAFAKKKLPEHTVMVTKGVYSYGDPAKGYFSMFVVTKAGVIAIEPVNPDHSKGLLGAIQAVTKKPVKYVLYSHNHWDHSSGAKVFKDQGAEIVAHAEAVQWMQANPRPDVVAPAKGWTGKRKDITLSGRTIELHYLGMNHGLGMTVFRLPKEKVIYVADLVTPKRLLFTIVPDFNVKEYERTLKDIEAMDWKTSLYSHGARTGTKKDVKELYTFIADLRGAIYAEFKKGTNPFMVPTTVRLPKYKGWANYDNWLEMNAWRIMLDDHMGPFPWRPHHDSIHGKLGS